jgi:holo-[acyl-carrier protein] synthase
MKIYGIGIDIVETARIEQSVEKFGDRFLQRIYLPAEVEYSQKMKKPTLHLAARFAAKEALSKAFGTGIGKPVGWRDLEIVHTPTGAPQVVLHGGAAEFAKQIGLEQILVSLSHTEHYGAANAVIAVRD